MNIGQQERRKAMIECGELIIENTKNIEKLIIESQECRKDFKEIMEHLKENKVAKSDDRLISLEKKMSALSPVLTMCYYPKVTLFLIIATGALLVSDIRHPLLKLIGIM